MRSLVRDFGGKDNRPVRKKLFSTLMVLFMMSNIFVIILWDSQNAVAADLVVSGTHIVSGTENWDDITVTGTGKLVVPAGTILNALSITMNPLH